MFFPTGPFGLLFQSLGGSHMMEACLWGFYGGWIFELQWGPLMVIFHHGDAAEDKGKEAHENPRAYPWISSPIYLESSTQCPYGIGLHHHIYISQFGILLSDFKSC
ncbi:hypothetical protein HKD37_17G048402 [Glycine soja]